MTIVEAIKKVLSDSTVCMTSKEIYDKIIELGLYSFSAQDPVSVVNAQIRRRCAGLDFPTAYPIKFFEIAGHNGKKLKFRLISSDEESTTIALPKVADNSEMLPEENIDKALKEHLHVIRNQILDCIFDNPPEFFEHMVVDLLLKMGYGYGNSAGKVTSRSHDGGIDGIISEDKLGLDLIYIQAKRYNSSKTVSRPEVQAFVGAMENIRKGVFITTSKFTKGAEEYISRQSKSIKLIDGELLTDLLVKYQVGVDVVQTINLFKVDLDYYNI